MAPRPLCYPDFILIGAPNTQMRALKQALAADTRVWFPPLDNILAFHHGFAIARIENLQKFLKGELKYKPGELGWLLRYFLKLTPSAEWYGTLFYTKDESLMKGELSEEYITLPHDQISKLYETIPECKIILTLRDPVERAYAGVRDRFEKNPRFPFAKMTKRQVLTVMNSDWARSHSAFSTALNNWYSFYPPEQILPLLYEDLLARPEEMLEKVRKFLGLGPEASARLAPLLLKPAVAFPDSLLKHLRPFYREEASILAKRIGGPAQQWYDRHPPPPPPAAITPLPPGEPETEPQSGEETAELQAPPPTSPLIDLLVSLKLIKRRTPPG